MSLKHGLLNVLIHAQTLAFLQRDAEKSHDDDDDDGDDDKRTRTERAGYCARDRQIPWRRGSSNELYKSEDVQTNRRKKFKNVLVLIDSTAGQSPKKKFKRM
jgi:hypothetical protein